MRAAAVLEHDGADALCTGTAAAAPELYRADAKHRKIHRPQHALDRVDAGTTREFPHDQEHDTRQED
jgi:hypothetical protein